jgi:hypothetical protein
VGSIKKKREEEGRREEKNEGLRGLEEWKGEWTKNEGAG